MHTYLNFTWIESEYAGLISIRIYLSTIKLSIARCSNLLFMNRERTRGKACES